MTITDAAWDNIPDRTADTGNDARTRIATALDTDPFVRMLSTEVRGCMVEAFARAVIFDKPVRNSAAVSSHTEIKRLIKPAMAAMPLGFLTPGFIEHVLSLVAFALHPHPTYDGWGDPV